MGKIARFVAQSCLVLFFFVASCDRANAQYQATVSSQPQQTIKGWGVFPAWPDWPAGEDILKSPAIQKALYKELGITLIRVRIFHDSYNNALDDGSLDTSFLDRTLVKHLQIAKKNGITQYFTSTWSPPVPMKKCNTWKGKCPDGSANSLKPEREDDYVRYNVKVLKYLKSKGLGLPVAFSIQNEPDAAVDWDGCVYSKEQFQRVVKKMRAAFDANGLQSVKIHGPEGATLDGSWERLGGVDLPDLYNDAKLNQAIGFITHHTYHQWSWGTKDVNIMKRYSNAAVRTGKDLWMTEWAAPVGSTQIDKTLNEMRHLARDLVIIKNNYWVWWMGWWLGSGSYNAEQTLLYGNPSNPTKTQRFDIYKRLWNSVRPGYVVKHLTTNDPDLKANNDINIDMVAFDGAKSMVVLFNNHTWTNKKITVKRLAGTNLRKYQTTSTENMADKGSTKIVRGSAIVSLPAKSVVLIVTNAGNGGSSLPR
jgi:O-glycosyl hydrolase